MFGMTDADSDSAIELLERDHDEVEKLFAHYEDIKDGAGGADKESLVAEICDALTVHAQVEEQIFYPAARRALADGEGKDMLDEAAVEHQSLKDIIARLEAASTGDPLYDAGVKVLSEYVKHHVKEEEKELFPRARASGMDLDAVGRQLAARKRQLTSESSAARRTGNGRRRPANAARASRDRGAATAA